MSKLLVAKGKKVTRVDLKKDGLSDTELAAFLLGQTGNLRAPTLQTGKTTVVGFNEELYEEVFG